MVVLAQLAPVLLLPLFYRFKPLDRPALVERLLALAARAKTRIRGVFEWTLSAHTKKANAALTGMGHTRRILLSDTLLADYSDDEIEVVLAHELSHHVHHDLWRAVAVQAALLVRRLLSSRIWRFAALPNRSRCAASTIPPACRCCCWPAARARSSSCRSPTRCRARRSGAPIAMRST